MISVDVCTGKQTECNVPPDRISAYMPPLPDADAAVTAAVVLPEGGNGNGSHDPAAAAASKPPVLWVDVSSPTAEDWKTLGEQFRFHPLALEDAQQQNQRAKVDVYPGYLFLSVRAWGGHQTATDDLHDVTHEIDIFLGPNYLVTIHAEGSEPIQETRRRLERNPEHLNNQPGFLLYLLLDAIVDEYFPAMDEIDAAIDAAETQVYATDTASSIDMKPALALKKRLLLLRQAISPLRDVLNQLLRTDDPALLSPDMRVFYQDVYDHTLRLVEQIDLHRDIMGGVMDAAMAQNSNRLNQVMKTMTGISTLLMSVTLIAGIYGMNFAFMPELQWRYGYFFALGSMALVGGALAVYFKKIKWF